MRWPRSKISAPELVILDEIAGEGREAAHRIENGSAQGDRGAETEAARAGDVGEHDARDEVDIVSQQCELLVPATRADALVQGAYIADALVAKGCSDTADIVRRREHVAVANDQSVVTRSGQCVLEILYLPVHDRLCLRSDYRRPLGSILPFQPAEQRQRRVFESLHRHHDLIIGVILAQGTAEIAFEVPLEPVDRLQQGDRRRFARSFKSLLVVVADETKRSR